jgi:hypothetical protein
MNSEQFWKGMDVQTGAGAELLWADFCSCAYEVSGSETPGGLYVFNRYHNRQYNIESPLPEPLHKKLEDIFQQCIVYYMPFVRDPEGFLHDVQHTLLWDGRSGRYAAAVKHRGDGPGEKMFVWLSLEPDGYVFASLLSLPETSEESKKWRIIREPAGIAALRACEGSFLDQNPNSRKALAEFSLFLTKHKGVRDYLYVNSLGIYQDIVSPPAQTRGEETGQKEIAIGFVSGHPKYTVIVAQEPTGAGWVLVSLVRHARAERLRAKLSGLKRNSGGVRWKPIDVPYGAQIYMDPGVVFYKLIRLRKPEGGAAYTFEYKSNRSETYVRFPYVFRSREKVIGFVERANAFRLKTWIRAEVK